VSTGTNDERVILVDEADRAVGTGEKAAVHQGELPLHRAFSVYLFDPRGRMLITKRSDKKVTWPGFWSNACCSHPRPGEATAEAALRRLDEELGLSADVEELFAFTYSARYDETWGEHELDHVFVGHVENPGTANPDEIADWRFVTAADLRRELADTPGAFTPWFCLSVERVLASVSQDAVGE